MKFFARTFFVCLSFALSSVAYAAGCSDPTLTSLPAFAVGKNALGVAAADLDKDGNLDLITTDAFTSNVYVHSGNGDFSFDAKVAYPVGRTHTQNPVAGDFNEDGWVDVGVQAGSSSNLPYVVVILLNQQNGTLVAQTPIEVGYEARETYVADVNDDGHLDIYLPGMTPPVLRGVGNGTFVDGVAGFNGEASGAGDFDSDGKTDIVEYHDRYAYDPPYEQLDSTLSIFPRQNGNPEYTLLQALDVSPTSAVLTVGDFNGDGAPDVATAHRSNEKVVIYMNDGTGMLTRSELTVNQDATRILAVDVTEDGLHDLVIASANGSGLITLKSNGDGTFGEPLLHNYGWHNVYGMVAGDFNNDGRPDFVAMDGGGGTDADPADALRMRNDCAATYAAVTVTSSPNPSAYLATVTIVAHVTPRDIGTAPTGTVSFYAGNRLLGSATLTALTTESVASLDVSNLPPGGSAIRAVYSGNQDYPVAYSEVHKHIVQRPAFGTPTALVATGQSNGTVKLTWVGGTGSLWYIVERGGANGSRTRLTEYQVGEWFIDTTAENDQVHIYYVAARREGDLLQSNFSAPDIAYATTTPLSIVSGGLLRASDVVRLRAMVTSLTRLTNLAAPAFTDPSLAGLRPKPVHVNELRTAADAARASLGLPAMSWSAAPVSGGAVLAREFDEVRQSCN